MIITRFPPEPNGFLHLGHLKSIFLNFNYPNDNEGGYCYLRLDDTNPETERQEFVDKIIDNIGWLGYEPYKITYTSDYFDILYNYALTSINKGFAYIDELSNQEISEYRNDNKKSPWRNRSIVENLELLDNMKNGKYKENSKCLRLKIDDTDNSSMQDPIAYRIKYTPHYRTGNKWCIYPSYDMSHCIVDSIEGITHSFCTLEFYLRRELYYWVLDKLELRKPIVKEFNELKTNFGILSKRKIKELVDAHTVNGWDDSLLLTIDGLRNRGYDPRILKNFCQKLGYTLNSQCLIQKYLLDDVCRDYLNINAERCFGIIEPLKITIINFDNNDCHLIKRPINPLCLDKGYVEIKLIKTIYIDQDDFRINADPKYFRLKLNGCVRLKYAGIISYISHNIDNNGNIVEIFVAYSSEQKKVKGTIHWTSNQIEKNIIFFDYDKMEKLKKIGYVDDTESDYLQFERIGYFKKINSDTYHHLCNLREHNKV